MKKIFVTGGSGFIGKNFVEAFSNKYQLLVPSHKELDLLDTKSVQKYIKRNRFDLVVHLANRGGNQKEANIVDPISVNLRIFFNIVRNQNYFGRMIFTGSGAEYGKQYAITRVTEEDFDKRIPEDDFGFYKYVVAKQIEQSKNIINLRVFGIFGKYEDWHFRFISNSICRTLLAQPIIISNNCFFDYIYIDDFLKVLEHFIEKKPKFNTYNVGGGKRLELLSIAKRIVAISGIDVPVIVKNKKLGNEYTCSNKRLKGELHGFEYTNLDRALENLIAWYRKNISLNDKKRLSLKRVDIWNKTRL